MTASTFKKVVLGKSSKSARNFPEFLMAQVSCRDQTSTSHPLYSRCSPPNRVRRDEQSMKEAAIWSASTFEITISMSLGECPGPYSIKSRRVPPKRTASHLFDLIRSKTSKSACLWAARTPLVPDKNRVSLVLSSRSSLICVSAIDEILIKVTSVSIGHSTDLVRDQL